MARCCVASEDQNADLFWAIRGGGGNFGVCTSFEYQLHPVEDVYWGPMFYEVEEAENVLRFYRDFIKNAPEEMGAFPAFQIAPPLPFIPEDRHGDTFVAIVACWSGPPEEGEERFRPFHEVAEVKAELVGRVPYPAINAAFDGLFPKGIRQYWKGNFVKELSDEAIAAHVEHGPKAPTVSSTMHLYPIDGACHRVAPDATAFGHRDANFAMVVVSAWEDPADDERQRAMGTGLFSRDGAPLRSRWIHQLHGQRRHHPSPGELREQLRPPRRGEAQVRPRQPLQSQSKHRPLTLPNTASSQGKGGAPDQFG